MRLLRSTMLFVLGGLVGGSIFAQTDFLNAPSTDIRPDDVIHWNFGSAEIDANGKIAVDAQLRTEQEFSIYTEKLTIVPLAGLQSLSPMVPKTQTLNDPLTGKVVKVYSGGDFRFFFQSSDRPTHVRFELGYLGCTSRICLFPVTKTIELPLVPASGIIAAPAAAATSESLESQFARGISQGDFPLWMMLLALFVGGFATNLTPCVAPMIPITIRLLARQKYSPTLNASIYALGIMITYTLLGTFATLSGSAFGTFMSSGLVNAGFAVVMALLGLSMLGFADFTLFQTLGSRLGGGEASAKNTFLMGAGAGLVAAPCTGPVLGALLTYSAGRSAPVEGLLLMMTYSFGFALPYVLLGRAASSVTKVKVSPLVQVATKLVFASVMFALTFYYLRIPFYNTMKLIRPYWYLGTTIGLGLGTAGILACVFTPRLQNLKAAFILPCLFFGAGVFSAWQWQSTKEDAPKILWHHTLDEAVAASLQSGKPILMDNWAEWCEACKKMDVTTFVDPEVVDELTEGWELVKLDLTEGTEADDKHLEFYGITGLPTLVLLRPGGGQEGKMNIVGLQTPRELLEKLRRFGEP